MTKTNVKINGDTYKLNKGIAFFNALGILPKSSEKNLGVVSDLVIGLKGYDPFAVQEILAAALTEEDKITNKEIENFVFEEAEIEKEADKLLSFLETTAICGTVKMIRKELDHYQAMTNSKIQEAMN